LAQWNVTVQVTDTAAEMESLDPEGQLNVALDGPALYVFKNGTWQVLASLSGAPPQGSEGAPGLLELATPAETLTGTDTTRAVHPAGLDSVLDARVGAASEAAPGIIELASPAETQTGTDAVRAVHPAGLKSTLDGRFYPQIASITAPGNYIVWTDMPAAQTEFFLARTNMRHQIDLTGASQARITTQLNVAGASGAELRLQYSTDNGSTWNNAAASGNISVSVDAAGQRVGAWASLAAGAKADVLIRLVGINGNGAADPEFGLTTAQFK
jgi:hypothetical protein